MQECIVALNQRSMNCTFRNSKDLPFIVKSSQMEFGGVAIKVTCPYGLFPVC